MKPWAKAAVQGAACGLMLGMVVLIGWPLWQPLAVAEVVKARSFEMVDAARKPRVVLAVPDGSPGLGLYDAAGKRRAHLSMLPDGRSGLTLHDAAGKVIWKAP